MKKISLLILLLAVGLGVYGIWSFPHRAQGGPGKIEIKKGMGLQSVINELQKAEIIHWPFLTHLYLRYKKVGAFLKVGEYEFPAKSTPESIAEKLIKAERLRKTFTIPEGYNLQDIAKLLKEKGVFSSELFFQRTQSPELLKPLGLEGTTLEGYLFPDTYEYTSETKEEELLTRMVENFKKHFDEKSKQRALELGMSPYQALILASIVEKETGKAEERPLIAGVFYNRLKIGMPLATDPAVIYGVPNFDGNLRRADLEREGPYNTYLRPGLPPTPIANPGAKSLEAVLYPTPSEYLFFVSKGDGSHQFSKTYEEHQAAVKQYQLRPQTQPISESQKRP